MKQQNLLLALIVGVLVIISGLFFNQNPDPIIPDDNDDKIIGNSTISIAAFNIQIFGKTKRTKMDVMEVLVRIVREFDLVLVQELRDSSETTAPLFLEMINNESDHLYDFIRSERLGRSSSKEAYAYYYNTETVTFVNGSDFVYNDTSDIFEREPYIASFTSGTFDFTLVGIHTKPTDAYNEIGNLTSVVTSIMNKGNESDIIVMGDFNADGTYFDEDDTSSFKDPQYTWIINNTWDTMTKTGWTYDRIVLGTQTCSYEYIQDSAQVFYFDEAYNLIDPEFVQDVSDHYPVYAEYWNDLLDDD